MTVKELYETAKKNKVENYDIQLQYQDGGGTYNGTCEMEDFSIDDDKEEITLY